jgi:hypothetical protein
MTWSYNAAALATTTASTDMTKVRLFIGDTDTDDQQLQDEEISYILTAQPIISYAAADCADLLAAKYSRQVTTQNGMLRVTASLRQEQYAALAKRLRSNGAGDTPGGVSGGAILAEAYVGGIDVTARNALLDDSDNVLPSVGVGQDDFPVSDNLTDTNYFTE